MKYITIDDYYNIDFYNETLQALKNNDVGFAQYIMTIAPYHFVIEIFQEPIMINYDNLPDNKLQYLINVVEPATPRDEYLLQRRESFGGIKGLKQYGLNNPLREAEKSDYACFFHLKNRAEGIELSKTLGKIYFFGTYIKNTHVALCTNKMIKNLALQQDILVEKKKSVLDMEHELNYKYFRLQNRLRKFTNTPYFDNGIFHNVKIKQFDFNI